MSYHLPPKTSFLSSSSYDKTCSNGNGMDSSVGKVIYCCVWRNSKILYSYNGGDHTLETLAADCLRSAPAYHSHYLHTSGGRTLAFYWDRTETYFAILDPNLSSSGSRVLKLLRQVREGFKNGSGDELAAVIRLLVDSMEESMSHVAATTAAEEEEDRNGLSGEGSSSTKALLMAGGNREEEITVEVVDPATRDLLLLQRKRFARELWWRHFKIVAAVDAVVCLSLFGIWLAVCRGFRCVT